MDKSKLIIISLGGSLIVPNGGIDVKFCIEFNQFIRQQIALKRRFFIVVGGGATARHYIEAARKTVGKITNWDLDWLGIHSTRLNAHLIKTIFHDLAHPRVVANYEKKIKNQKEPLVIAAGWKPGFSTDYDAVFLAREYHVSTLINMSDITSVYDKDPHRFPDAQPLSTISWDDFEKLVGEKWSPGYSFPFDPIATKLAKKLKLTVYIVGKDLKNLNKLLSGKKFLGTVIK